MADQHSAPPLSLPPPGPMSFDGNLADNWERWRDEYHIYLAATERLDRSDDVKISILLNLIGPEGREEFRRFDFVPPTDKTKLDKVLEKFDDRCAAQKNTILNRYQLFKIRPHEDEHIDAFQTRLKTLLHRCKYGNFESQMMRDIIIFTIRDGALQDRILQLETTLSDGTELTVEKVMSTIRNYEAAKKTGKIIRGEETDTRVETTRVQRQRLEFAGRPQDGGEQRVGSTQSNQDGGRQRNQSNGGRRYDCSKCGFQHAPRKCPAYGEKCHQCGEMNHYARQCPINRSKHNKQRPRCKQVRELQYEDTDEDDEITEFVLGELNAANPNSTGSWYEKVRINNIKLNCKLDTGAECNVIPTEIFGKLKGALSSTKCKIYACGKENEHPLKVRGKTILCCEIKHKKYNLPFYVADIQPDVILGLKSCVDANLVKRVNIISKDIKIDRPIRKQHCSWKTKDDLLKEFSDVFDGNGKFETEVHLQVDPKVTPMIRPPRRVPFKLHDRLKKSLKSMENRGIIRKVNHPTDWVNDLVIVETPGHGEHDLRICLDPRDLNKALKREHHKMPTAEDILNKVGGTKYYTVLDMKEGFWTMPLDQASTDLCTFHTPFGRYQFLRMPYGLNVAPEIFQRTNEEFFSGLSNMGIVMDDFIIGGNSIEEHDKNLRNLLDRARQVNAKFKTKKLQFRTESVNYIGLSISKAGTKPKADNVLAITNMKAPKSQRELKRFMGMVNFFSPFIPMMAQRNAPLRTLLKQEYKEDFQWNHEQQMAFEDLKTILSSKPVLQTYDRTKPCTIQADASQHGMGACLLQEGRPIAFASASLTETQQRYAQIEKELLAAVYACEKFYIYIYGGVVEIQTDHKPLLAIMHKPFHKLTPRIQRMVLRLQRFDLRFQYVPGPDMHIADALSRTYTPQEEASKMEEELDFRVHHLTRHLNLSEEWEKRIRTANEQDEETQNLIHIIEHGWPDHRRDLKDSLKKYWTIRDNLTVYDGVIFNEERVTIPNALRKEVLILLHEGHWGIAKSLRNARQTMYWPGMNLDIEETVSKCRYCIPERNKQAKEPLKPHELPDEPWMKLGADIFNFRGVPYLLVVDYYSRYPEFIKLQDKTANSVIMALKVNFARFGIPEIIVADNMPFNSSKFKIFAKEWKFKIITTSPHYPQSNGLAERNIQTIKHLLRKTLTSNGDPNYAILEFRNTPINEINLSPAQLLMGRRLRTKLPAVRSSKNHKLVPNPREIMDQWKIKVKLNYDNHARPLPPLQTEDVVRFRHNDSWERGQVIGKHTTPRSYWIRSPSEKHLRRNRRDILKTREEPPETIQEEGLPENTQEKETPNITPAFEGQQQPGTRMGDYKTRTGRTTHRPGWLKDFV